MKKSQGFLGIMFKCVGKQLMRVIKKKLLKGSELTFGCFLG